MMMSSCQTAGGGAHQINKKTWEKKKISQGSHEKASQQENPEGPPGRVMSHHTQCLLSNPKPKVTRISPPIFPKHSGRCSSEDFCSWKNKNSDHQRLCSRCCNSHFLSSPLDKKLAASVPKINVKDQMGHRFPQ